MVCFAFVFFFKQKTAYEMRISDWSSDVCSSDLFDRDRAPFGPWLPGGRVDRPARPGRVSAGAWRRRGHRPRGPFRAWQADRQGTLGGRRGFRRKPYAGQCARTRSEEHTSELQSLMRNSYAVFCLKKNKSTHTISRHHTQQI